jgi:6-pyruvoyltetrahydropterin/6-carboxytetrahydropterin synthase
MEGVMQHRGEFSVSVAKDYLVFSSAHFITFAGHRCEGLHGHNYRARATVEGALDQET